MSKRIWTARVALIFVAGLLPAGARGQERRAEDLAARLASVSAPSMAQASTSQTTSPTAPAPAKPAPAAVHRFWDRENDLLFAGVGASRALDYASTLNLRRRGIDEALLTNSIVDNHPLFAGIETAATAASIGVSYIFHATGHHRLERWTSYVHIGIATGGAIRNYALKTPH